jgi:hypothetical protein
MKMSQREECNAYGSHPDKLTAVAGAFFSPLNTPSTDVVETIMMATGRLSLRKWGFIVFFHLSMEEPRQDLCVLSLDAATAKREGYHAEAKRFTGYTVILPMMRHRRLVTVGRNVGVYLRDTGRNNDVWS